MRSLSSLFIASLLLGACGNSNNSEDGLDASVNPPDAGTTTDAQVSPPNSTVFAVGSGGGTGILTKIALPELEVQTNVVVGVASNDAVVRLFNDKLYIVNRLEHDNITIINPETKQFITQLSTGSGSNPQDIAIVGTSIYVCSHNTGTITILDESDEGATPKTIDISAYDEDEIPNCTSIAAVNGKIFAVLGLLNEQYISQGGKVLVIDPATNTITSDFDLVYNNPFGLLATTDPNGPFGGDLLIGTTEDFATGNGCIERITTGATPESAGCLIENSSLGGYTSVLQVHGETAFAAVTTGKEKAKLIRVSSNSTLNNASITPVEQYITDFVVCPTDTVVTNDKSTSGTNQQALRVYELDGKELTETGLDIGLPPAFTNGLVCF